jgi:hypothetical protein
VRSKFFSFPDPVNEKAARTVAFVVLLGAATTLATSAYWLLVPLAYGFLARTLAGPRLSPLGGIASKLVAPRLGAVRPVPGPPKHFAQAIGATLTTVATIAALGFGAHGIADVLLTLLLVAAALESLLAYCVGCQLFGLLMRVGLIPAEVCVRCANLNTSIGPLAGADE